MGDSNERLARSASRPFWFDPRFAIGVILVVGSVLGVSFVVATVDDTVEVYTARTMLPAGTAVSAGDLDVTAVRLGTSGAHYLAVDDLPKDGLVLSRAVAAGELLPLAALEEHATLGHTSVVVTVGGDVAAAVAAGATVDLWAAPQLEHGRFGSPAIVVSSAEVVRLIDGGGFIGGDSGRSVELRVPTGSIAAVLQSTANADALSLVPASPDAKPAQRGRASQQPSTEPPGTNAPEVGAPEAEAPQTEAPPTETPAPGAPAVPSAAAHALISEF